MTFHSPLRTMCAHPAMFVMTRKRSTTLWPKQGEPVALPLGAYEDGVARDINDMGVIVGNLTRF
ncbi:MAG TPA: hypothetical protein VI072_32735, partial [Polyangiaceae bacterium]